MSASDRGRCRTPDEAEHQVVAGGAIQVLTAGKALYCLLDMVVPRRGVWLHLYGIVELEQDRT